MNLITHTVNNRLENKILDDTLAPNSIIKWRLYIGFILLTGISFRLFHLINNRSLWIDEAYLVASLIKMNFLELAKPPLEYEQKAPLGFLWIVKLLTIIFGKGEMALRLLPFISGVGSLLAFVPVARFFLKPLGVVIAISVLALAPPLIFHTVEIKQYSTELFAAILTLYLYTKYHNKSTYSSLLTWGLWGATIIWFSYSSIFMLVGIAFSCCLTYLFQKDWKLLFRSSLAFSFWAISFVINYFLLTYKHSDSEWLTSFFRVRESFMPMPPTTWSELKWFAVSFYRVLDYPLGLLWNFGMNATNLQTFIKLIMAMFAISCLVIGLASFFKQDKKLFMILSFPIILTLIASGLELYPFYERLLVFLSPLFIIFIARGCVRINNYLKKYIKLQYFLPALLLAWPLGSSANQVVNPSLFGGIKSSFDREAYFYIKNHLQENDIVYVYWNIMHSYNYYKDAYGLTYPSVIEGKDNRLASKDIQEYFFKHKADFDTVAKHRRVWYIHNKTLKLNIGDFDNKPAWYHAQELEPGYLFKEKFSTMGKPIDVFETSDVRVMLFEIKP